MTADQDDDRYYVIVCKDCDGDDPELWMPVPFPSPEERGRWASLHKAGTGHDRWFVIDQRKETP